MSLWLCTVHLLTDNSRFRAPKPPRVHSHHFHKDHPDERADETAAWSASRGFLGYLTDVVNGYPVVNEHKY